MNDPCKLFNNWLNISYEGYIAVHMFKQITFWKNATRNGKIQGPKMGTEILQTKSRPYFIPLKGIILAV